MSEPIDGWTVDKQDGVIVLIFSNRYGEGEVIRLAPEDAVDIGNALIYVAESNVDE